MGAVHVSDMSTQQLVTYIQAAFFEVTVQHGTEYIKPFKIEIITETF